MKIFKLITKTLALYLRVLRLCVLRSDVWGTTWVVLFAFACPFRQWPQTDIQLFALCLSVVIFGSFFLYILLEIEIWAAKKFFRHNGPLSLGDVFGIWLFGISVAAILMIALGWNTHVFIRSCMFWAISIPVLFRNRKTNEVA